MDKQVNISITAGTIIKVFLLAGLFYLIYFFQDLALAVLTAIVVASAVEPLVKRLEKVKLPRIASVAIVYTGLVAVMAAILITIVPTIAEETVRLLQALPGYLKEANVFLNSQADGSDFIKGLVGSGDVSLESLIKTARDTAGFAAGGFANFAGSLFGSLLNLALIFVLSFYLASQEYGIDNFLKVVVPPKQSKYAINLWRRSQRKIALWMQGQLIVALLTGVFTYLALAILGVPYAFILAVIAGLSELIPVVGFFLSAIPAIGIAFASGGTGTVIFVAGFYVLWQQIQGNLIYPLVVNKVVGVPPLLVILSLIIGGSLFGFLGMILSVPVAAALMEYVKDIEKEHSREIMRRKMEDEALAEKIAEKVVEKTESMPKEA